MTNQPNYGQRSETYEWIACYRHPREQAISKCKRCQRDTCLSCTIPTEVSTICAECASEVNPRMQVVNGGSFSGPKAKTAAKRSINLNSWLGAGASLSVTNALIIGISVISLLGFVFDAVVFYLAFHPVGALLEPWRFVTVMLVHGGFIHLLFNMYSLYLVGNPLERTLGVAKYLGIFIASVLGGSLAVLGWALATSSTSWSVGASGGIFGLFAAVFILQRQTGVDARSMGLLLVINLAISFTFSGISWQAHLGGMLTGGLLTWLVYKFALPRPGKTVQETQLASRFIFGSFFGIVAVLIFVGNLMLS
ncbi:MAG: rhomboid family intramembrane serine protease [Actinomycetaceae bacterium]|nr:rhomboid family intramembrane serine protease [Actinomycetaceae bacterium]